MFGRGDADRAQHEEEDTTSRQRQQQQPTLGQQQVANTSSRNNKGPPSQRGTTSCQVLPVRYYIEAAQVMAEAFSDSPAYNYIFQETASPIQKKRVLQWMFHAYIVAIAKRCPTALRGRLDNDLDDDGKDAVICCFLWVESPHDRVSTWDLIMAGLWQGPFRLGLSALQRLLATLDAFQADAHHFGVNSGGENNNRVMLERMAVRSDRRGQGIGSSCLRQVILAEQAAAAAPGDDNHGCHQWDICLNTQTEANVRFYQRLGFVVVHEAIYFPTNDTFKYHQWAMKYTIRK
jgi:GNAT superfamily N-acetyltransferase